MALGRGGEAAVQTLLEPGVGWKMAGVPGNPACIAEILALAPLHADKPPLSPTARRGI